MMLLILSIEVILFILRYLDPKDVVRLANTSRIHRKYIENLNYWKRQHEEWNMTTNTFVQINRFVHMELKNDPLGYGLMRHYVLLKKLNIVGKKLKEQKLYMKYQKNPLMDMIQRHRTNQ
jgi:hypothetical protein